MGLKEIRRFSKEKLKENWKVLVVIQTIIFFIGVGLSAWLVGTTMLFPGSILQIMVELIMYGLMAVFITGSAAACLKVLKGEEAKVEQVFYLFRNKTKQVLWLIFRKFIITLLIAFLINFFGGIIPYAIGLDDPYMPAISSFLASVIVELRYFPALYLLLEGEEEISRKAIWRGNDMMHKNYIRLLGLCLSFLPWMLLALIPCGLGLLIVTPWYQISLAVFYTDLKRQEKSQIEKGH